MVKTPSANAGDTVWTPDLGRFPHASGQPSPVAATSEATCCSYGGSHTQKPVHQTTREKLAPKEESSPHSKEDPAQTKIKKI